MTRLHLTAGLLLMLLLSPSLAAAAEQSCSTEIYDSLGREERLFRSVLFGADAAADLPQGSTIIDKDGDHWMKTGVNGWESPEHDSLTWSNILVDEQRDVPVRRGILEIRQAPTSELIPQMLQSVRAMRCRMKAVCTSARASRADGAGTTTVKVQPDGCIEFELPVIESCKTVDLTTIDTGACSSEVDRIVDRESRMLELIVAYDASYRTLMQFAGTFEGFLSDFSFPLLQPLWQMVRVLGQYDNLPCFLAECNE